MLSRTGIVLLGVMVIAACGSSGDGSVGPARRDGTPADPLDPDRPPQSPAQSSETSPPAPPAPPSALRCEPGRKGAAGDRTLTLIVDGQERTALLHVPQSYDPIKGTSVVLAFHGYGSTAEYMKTQAGLDVESDKRGFIVAHVQGTGLARQGFNGGDCCGRPAWSDETDDLGLAREINKAIAADYCVDSKRVYSAGFSNGGFMSYRFACEAADLFAAVASVSGVLGTPPESCKPSRPLPILHVHGTADTTVPFNGGPAAGGLGAIANINFRSVDETLSHFRTRWACGAASKLVSEKGDTRCEEWTGCQAGARIELCTVTGGGHQWPGGPSSALGGKTSTDFAATSAILDFFAAHPMP
jgi:polyhydroxybutyrate depolymerase